MLHVLLLVSCVVLSKYSTFIRHFVTIDAYITKTNALEPHERDHLSETTGIVYAFAL